MTYSKRLERIINKSSLLSDANDNVVDLENSSSDKIELIVENLKQFLGQVETTFSNQDQKIEQAERSLALSSEELSESNKKLFAMNQTIKTILDNLTEGLVVFDKNGSCLNFASLAAQKHFGKDFEKNKVELHEILTSREKESTLDWVSLLFDGTYEFENITPLGITELVNREGRELRLDYRGIYGNDNKLEQVLLISKDVTEELKAIREAEKQKAAAKTIFEILNSPRAFIDLFSSSRTTLELLTSACNGKCNVEIIDARRHVHTLKGNFSTFYLLELVQEIHHLESLLVDLFEPSEFYKKLSENIPKLTSMVSSYEKQYSEIAEKLTDSGASGGGNQKSLNDNFFSYLVKNLGDTSPVVAEFRKKYLLQDFKVEIRKFQSSTLSLADRLGKQLADFEVTGDEILIDSSKYQDFFLSIVHVFTNICDHGIEIPEVRTMLGKPKEGKIAIKTELVSPQKMRFSISDDGKGVDLSNVQAKIRHYPGLYKKYEKCSDTELMQAIFENGFSTKDVANETSGRGVGLDAVKSTVENMGGTVRVESQLHVGTKFVFEIPVLTDQDLAAQVTRTAA